MQYERSRIRQFTDAEQQICNRNDKRKAEYLAQIAYADGRNDLIGISDILQIPVDHLIPIKEELLKHQLLTDK